MNTSAPGQRRPHCGAREEQKEFGQGEIRHADAVFLTDPRCTFAKRAAGARGGRIRAESKTGEGSASFFIWPSVTGT